MTGAGSSTPAGQPGETGRPNAAGAAGQPEAVGPAGQPEAVGPAGRPAAADAIGTDDAAAIAATVIDALEDYQRVSREIYEKNPDDPEAVVKGLVRLHLGWTEENRDTAILIARHRHEVAAGPEGKRLAESNKEMFRETKAWIAEQAEAARMPATSFNLMHAVVFAPTQEIAKLWLTGRLKTPLADQVEALADAAWAGVVALPDRSATTS